MLNMQDVIASNPMMQVLFFDVMEGDDMRTKTPMQAYEEAQTKEHKDDYYDEYYNEMQKKIDCDRARALGEKDAKADLRK